MHLVHWVGSLCVIQDALEQIVLTKTDSKAIANAIQDFLLHYQLPISKCHGQAYNGASNMSGVIKGVTQRNQNEEESAVYVYCLAHSLNSLLLGTQFEQFEQLGTQFEQFEPKELLIKSRKPMLFQVKN